MPSNRNADVTGDQVVTLEGTARLDPDGPRASAHPADLAKYQPMLDGHGRTVDRSETDYPVVVRITPTRWRVA